MEKNLFFIALLVSVLFTALKSEAAPWIFYGAGSRAGGLAGAVTADATPVSAVYSNPALIGNDGNLSFMLDGWGTSPKLNINGKRTQSGSQGGITAGMASPLNLGWILEDRIRFGLIAHFPTGSLLDSYGSLINEPRFAMWDGTGHGIAVNTGFAFKIFDFLNLGFALSILPNANGKVKIDFASEKRNNITDVEVPYVLGYIGGLSLKLPYVSIGVRYHSKQKSRVDTPVNASVAENAMPISARVTVPLIYHPQLLSGGFAFGPFFGLSPRVELWWLDYSSFEYPSPDVKLFNTKGRVIDRSHVEAKGFKDILSPRLGIEWKIASFLRLRGGYAYTPTPIPPQTGVTNAMDGDRHDISLGFGFLLEKPWKGFDGGIGIDLNFQYTAYEERGYEKEVFDIDNPGFPTVRSSGHIYSGGAGLKLWF